MAKPVNAVDTVSAAPRSLGNKVNTLADARIQKDRAASAHRGPKITVVLVVNRVP